MLKIQSFSSVTSNPYVRAVAVGIAAQIAQKALIPASWAKDAIQTSRFKSLISNKFSPVLAAVVAFVLFKVFARETIRSIIDNHVANEKGQYPRPQPKCVLETDEAHLSILSNYRFDDTKNHDIFCDALDYRYDGKRQIIAIADGCGVSEKSRRTAQYVVDGFMQTPFSEVPAEDEALKAAEVIQARMDEEYRKNSNEAQFGQTTFLGGLIHKGVGDERRFTGVCCGDSRLYKFDSASQTWSIETPAKRVAINDPGGTYGQERRESHKTSAYSLNINVNPGDMLLFVTDGVDDNFDEKMLDHATHMYQNEAEEGRVTDEAKLAVLSGIACDKTSPKAIGDAVMKFVFDKTAPIHQNQKLEDHPNCKDDHVSIAVVKVC